MRWLGFESPDVMDCLSDKHLILSVTCIYGLRRGSQEDFESAAEARHNRRHLARGRNHLLLNEFSRRDHLMLSVIDRSTHQVHLVASFDSCVADDLFKFGDFILDQ